LVGPVTVTRRHPDPFVLVASPSGRDDTCPTFRRCEGAPGVGSAPAPGRECATKLVTNGATVFDLLLAVSMCLAVVVVGWAAVEIERHLL